MRKHFPKGDIYTGYAMSEASGLISVNYPKPIAGSVGKLAAGMQVKVIHKGGDQCVGHEYGELCLKPRFQFYGYYGDDDSTDCAFDYDGWFLTGDVGFFSDEGFLFIVDQKRELMKYCGYQISPSELENVLLHHPAIKQVCVVSLPDPECTDLPAAVVVRRPNMEISEQAVADIIARKTIVVLHVLSTWW